MDNVLHKHSNQQNHYLPGLWQLVVAGEEKRAQPLAPEYAT